MSAHSDETYKSLISIAHEGFKYLALCNGGAIVALLAYLGNTASKCATVTVNLQTPIILFISGLVCGGLTMFFGYLTQFCLHNENIDNPLRWRHQNFLLAASFFFVASIVCFSIGALTAACRLTN